MNVNFKFIFPFYKNKMLYHTKRNIIIGLVILAIIGLYLFAINIETKNRIDELPLFNESNTSQNKTIGQCWKMANGKEICYLGTSTVAAGDVSMTNKSVSTTE